MARLPIPGSDKGTWGQVLNDFLSQAHAADGTLNSGTVGSAQLQDGAVSAAKIPDQSIAVEKLASAGVAYGPALIDAEGDVTDAIGEKLLSRTSANATFLPGQPVSTDGTDGLSAPTGVGLEFVINADGLDDIRFNGTSL